MWSIEKNRTINQPCYLTFDGLFYVQIVWVYLDLKEMKDKKEKYKKVNPNHQYSTFSYSMCYFLERMNKFTYDKEYFKN